MSTASSCRISDRLWPRTLFARLPADSWPFYRFELPRPFWPGPSVIVHLYTLAAKRLAFNQTQYPLAPLGTPGTMAVWL